MKKTRFTHKETNGKYSEQRKKGWLSLGVAIVNAREWGENAKNKHGNPEGTSPVMISFPRDSSIWVDSIRIKGGHGGEGFNQTQDIRSEPQTRQANNEEMI